MKPGHACALGLFSLALLIAPGILGWAAGSQDSLPGAARNDTQLRAMADELARSKTLSLSTLDKPYFIEYTSSDAEEISITASLGGITSSSYNHVRRPGATVRVGDYQFDNTNSVFSGSIPLAFFPLDDDYLVMRTNLWQSTDILYKAATDQITRKRNALREVATPEPTADLAHAEPIQVLEPPSKLRADRREWEATVRQVSAVFSRHPDVADSGVRLLGIGSTYRLVNTEGTLVRIPENLSALMVRSSALLPDGTRVWDHRLITGIELSELPKREQVLAETEALARETEALKSAIAADDYSGPVLFEREAAAAMMAQALTDALVLHRKPVTPPEARGNGEMLDSVWSSRAGSRVLPEWLSIRDDPGETSFQGALLAGHYTVDDEGVRAKRVNAVEAGMLRNFLLSREPVRNLNGSNGHGRLPGPFGTEMAAIGNLFVEASQTAAPGALRAQLLERVKAAGLPFGVVVRTMDFPSTAPSSELQNLLRQSQKNGYARTLTAPLLAYRVYPDGREELVRGFRFREFSAKDLRDILAAGDDPYVLNYVNNGVGFNVADIGSDATSSAVICPSLLLESVELTRAEGEAGSRPAVPAPELTAEK